MISEFEHYIRFERQLSEATIEHYLFLLTTLQKFLRQDITAGSDLDKINRNGIAAYLEHLKTCGISKSSVSAYVVALRAYYKWAAYFYGTENIKEASFYLNHIVKVSRSRKVPVTPSVDEVALLRTTLRQYLQLNSYDKASLRYQRILRAYAMIELLITSGLRCKELAGLRRKDIDLDGRVMFIKKGKGDHQRVSLFGDSAVEVLKEYFQYNVLNPEDFVFPVSHHTVIYNTVKLWARRSRINEKIHPHSFRHYFITESYRSGVRIETIADQVGQVDLNTTRGYTHLDINFIKQEYRAVKV